MTRVIEKKFSIMSVVCVIISSPEPFGSQGELIVYPSSRRLPSAASSVGVIRRSHCSKIFFSETAGNGILFAASASHDQDGRHAHIYGKSPSKIFFSRTGGPIFTKLSM